MIDLEERIARVHTPEVRPLVRDAYRSYTTGVARAAIVLTWTAVCTDLIAKVQVLKDDGEPDAKALAEKVEEAQALGADTDEKKRRAGVLKMREVERGILDTALKLELIDSSQLVQLDRLREDRHQSAHPSLRPLGELYEPTAEYARAHLLAALDALLIHPPSQGRKVVESFAAHVAAANFVLHAGHLTHTYFERVRPSARRRVVEFAAKFAVLQVDGSEGHLSAVQLAERMADCLRCFADQDAALVTQAVAKQMGRLEHAEPDVQVAAFARLGDLPAFWKAVPESLRGLFEAHLERIGFRGLSPSYVLSRDEVQVLGLVGHPELRQSFPGLDKAFVKLAVHNKVPVIARRPDRYHTPYLPEVLGGISTYESGAFVPVVAVLPCAPFLDAESLRAVLRAWWDNKKCWVKGRRGTLEAMYEATAHLGPERDKVWRPFVEELSPHEDLYRDLHRRFSWPEPPQTTPNAQ